MRSLIDGVYRYPKPPPVSWLQAWGLVVIGARVINSDVRSADRLFLVHQPGKVGSTSMTNAIKRAGLVGFQTHQLNPERRREIFRHYRWRPWSPRLMWGYSPWVRREVTRRTAETVLITGIRNPIEREISGVLQNPERFLTMHRRPSTDEEISAQLDELIRVVNHNLLVNRLDTWFASELDFMLGEPFPWIESSGALQSTGHAHHRGANGLSVHVVRFENLSEGFARVAAIEGHPDLVLSHDRRSNSPVLFERLKERGLDPASVEAALRQATVRSAYSDSEIRAWAAEWC